jgi:hypothetical protein
MAGDALGPWWVGIGAGIVSSLVAVIGKLWAELAKERRERGEEVGLIRHELAEANDRVVQLQADANQRGDVFQREHVRDLRRIAGLSTSVEPPPRSDPWPPVVIRSAPTRARPPPRKPGG